jgi:hypothetical protein
VSFDSAWLDLREPADRAARDPGLLGAAAAWLGGVAAPVALDLGCGTGAMVRALAAPGLRWRLVDHDAALLGEAARRCGGVAVEARDLRDLDAIGLGGVRLVTASALLDLVSAGWLAAFAGRLAAAGAGFYATLVYDGTMTWAPARPEDGAVRAAFNAHQGRDKGFGPALGPAAGAAAAAALAARGFAVRSAASPWQLGPADADLMAALAQGIAAAAEEGGVSAAAWAQARRAASGCSIGHVDLLALPAGASAQSKTTSEARP